MLCNQQVKQLCCHFFCLLVDKREQRPHSQSGSTNHGVKTITSPWNYLKRRRLRSKSLLAFAYANATPLFSTPPRRVNRLGLPIALAGQASKPLHPHGIYFRVQTAPLEKPACICLCKRNTAFLPLRRRAG